VVVVELLGLLMAVNCLHRTVPDAGGVLINYSRECFPTLNMHCQEDDRCGCLLQHSKRDIHTRKEKEK
jgi:hypothetical protein